MSAMFLQAPPELELIPFPVSLFGPDPIFLVMLIVLALRFVAPFPWFPLKCCVNASTRRHLAVSLSSTNPREGISNM